MTKKVTTIIISLGMLLGVPVAPSAAPLFNRADFRADAINYGFDNASIGDTVAGDGNLLLTSGIVAGAIDVNFNDQGFDAPKAYVVDQFNGFQMFFDEPVSAVGFNFSAIAGNSDWFFLALFDSSNTPVDSIFLDASGLGLCNDTNLISFRCGFIGQNVGVNTIAGVGFSSAPGVSIEAMDNIIYQQAPAPAAFWLIGLVFPVLFRKKITK